MNNVKKAAFQVLDGLLSIIHTGGSTSVASGLNLAVKEFQKSGRKNARCTFRSIREVLEIIWSKWQIWATFLAALSEMLTSHSASDCKTSCLTLPTFSPNYWPSLFELDARLIQPSHFSNNIPGVWWFLFLTAIARIHGTKWYWQQIAFELSMHMFTPSLPVRNTLSSSILSRKNSLSYLLFWLNIEQ